MEHIQSDKLATTDGDMDTSTVLAANDEDIHDALVNDPDFWSPVWQPIEGNHAAPFACPCHASAASACNPFDVLALSADDEDDSFWDPPKEAILELYTRDAVEILTAEAIARPRQTGCRKRSSRRRRHRRHPALHGGSIQHD